MTVVVNTVKKSDSAPKKGIKSEAEEETKKETKKK